jgi:phosphoglycolate phosphatase
MPATKTLISFDVDGTLIRATGQDANKLHKDAFAHGFLEVFGIETTIDVIDYQGSTDMLISRATMRHHGVDDAVISERMDAHCAAMCRYALERRENAADGLELLTGVRQLLEILSARADCTVCLVTGNLEPIAWAKMERLGIEHLFSLPRFGGFGSDHTDRGVLVKIAAQRSESQDYNGVPHVKRFHFGDTPMDVKAAEYAGATAIGLLTGVFSREDLVNVSKAIDPIVFDTLSDTESVLRAIGLT